jgi:TonB family protein
MVNVLAYVDRRGYVCRVRVVNGSGIDIIDSTVLDTVRAWRFSTGLVKVQPVASAYDFKISFILTDYQLGADYDFPRVGKVTSQ